jgi:hypothetical protein
VESTLTGNKVSGTREGVAFRIDNTIPECDTFGEVFLPNGAGGFQMVETCNPFLGATGSLRVVLVPVIDNFCNGSCDVTIKYFALLFLNSLGKCTGNSCEVTGTFVQKVFDPAMELGYTPGEPLGGPPVLIE